MEPVPARRAVASWVLYDLANTIFSFVVVSAYLGPWIHELGGRDSHFAVPNSLSMLVVLFLAPVLGAVTDRTRRMPFLAASTIVAVACTALLGLGQVLGLAPGGVLWTAVGFFFVANVAYQLGLVFYDALLPSVSTRDNVGRVGGLGVGVGYVGSFVGLGMATAVLMANPDGEAYVFLLAAGAFLVFSLPCFLFVRERRAERRAGGRGLLGEAFAGVRATLRSLPSHPGMGRFLAARVLYAEAANTVIFLMGIYAVTEAGFDDESLAYASMLGLGILAAMLASPLWGRLVDRIGPKNTLSAVLLLWAFTLTIVVLHPILGLPQAVFYILSVFVGVCLGGTWTADRPVLLGLAPADRVGEWFGLYALAGRFAAVTGPLIYALVVDVLLRDRTFARPVGILAFAVMMVASWLVLRKLPDPHRPDARPFAAILPWGDGSGRRSPRWWRLPAAAPFLLLYLAASWALFLPVAQPVSGERGFYSLPSGFREAWTYAIPDLTQDVGHFVLTWFTAPLLNHDLIQLVYVTFLLLVVGLAFEIKEGWRRAALVFVASGFVGGVVAGVLLHILYPAVSTHPILETAWERTWSGGSAGAFGLMGAFAARARNPWFFLAIFAVWEINVGYWFLRSYTPAFHLTALATGFLVTRFALKPITAAPPTSGVASRTD